jgi:hypothetical protein
LESIASREGKTERSIRMTLSLAFLAPDIVKAAVEGRLPRGLLIPEEAAPQFLDDAAPRNGMMPPPDSEMIAPPITE